MKNGMSFDKDWNVIEDWNLRRAQTTFQEYVNCDTGSTMTSNAFTIYAIKEDKLSCVNLRDDKKQSI